MKQTLQLRISQHLALTPQLQQSIRLLQLSTLELHQEIEQVLSDNPLLERLDDPLDRSVRQHADGAINSSPATPGEAPHGGGGEDEDGRPQREASPVTLREHLMDQVRLTCLAPRDCALVELIVDALDDNGYLEESLDEIHARLPAELEIEFDELR